MRRIKLFLILAVAPLLAVAGAQPPAAEEFLHGRVSFADGGGLIKGSADDDWSYATLNTLVLPGDTLWADQEGSVEVELSGGSFLRMADGSKAEVVQMDPDVLIRGWTGSFYLQRISRSVGEYVFETPACRVNVDANAQVRIDVVGEGSTTVSVRWGRALVTVTGQATPVVLSEGQRVYVDPGLLPSAPVPFDRTQEDTFDVWNRERAKLLAVGYSSVPIQTSADVIGVSDLNNYGDWVYVDSEPYWRPTAVVDYVPYRVGHWSYVPTTGYSWVGHYPFSYVTSHYGRWTYNDHYGWLWGYRPGWSGAWVASVRYGSNFLWCPVDFRGYPVYYGGSHFSVGGFRFGLYSSSYCGVNDLFYGPTSVFPLHHNILHGVHHNDIHIWNINVNIGRHRYGRDILPGTSLRVRDYSPRRVIRGPDVAGPRLESARTRIASLESSSPRVGFDRARSVDAARGARTSVASTDRGAQIRTARVRETDLQQTRNAVRRVLGQEQDGQTLTGRGSSARSMRTGLSEGGATRAADAATSLRTGGRNLTGAGGDVRSSRVPESTPSRGSSARTSRIPGSAGEDSANVRTPSRSGVTGEGADHVSRRAGEETGVRTPAAGAATDGVRQRTERSAAPRATGVDSRTPAPADRTATVPSVRTPRSTSVPESGSRVPSQRTEPRVTSPTPSAPPSRTPSSPPSVRTEPRVSAPPSRTPSSPPSVRTEPRVSAPPSRTPSSPPSVRTEPRVSAPPSRTPSSPPSVRTEPRVSAPAPQQRSVEPRVTAPQQRGGRQSSLQERTVAPRASAPPPQSYSRSVTTVPSAPPVSSQRSTVRSSAPPVSSPRYSSPAPRMSNPPAPSIRSSAPSYSSPRSTGRSISAPAPSSRGDSSPSPSIGGGSSRGSSGMSVGGGGSSRGGGRSR